MHHLEKNNWNQDIDIIGESTITNYSCFIDRELIEECSNNYDLVMQSAMLEAAKMDMKLKNWLKEGEDYKGLKADVKKLIAANNLDDSKLKTGKKGLMHICKRILQVMYDISLPVAGVSTAATVAGAFFLGPVAGVASLIGSIVGFVIGFIINRLLRLAVDTVEFDAIRDDAYDIKDQLERKAKDEKNEKLAEKYKKEAEKLGEAIKRYSKSDYSK